LACSRVFGSSDTTIANTSVWCARGHTLLIVRSTALLHVHPNLRFIIVLSGFLPRLIVTPVSTQNRCAASALTTLSLHPQRRTPHVRGWGLQKPLHARKCYTMPPPTQTDTWAIKLPRTQYGSSFEDQTVCGIGLSTYR
jgi:hypothetical protein